MRGNIAILAAVSTALAQQPSAPLDACVSSCVLRAAGDGERDVASVCGAGPDPRVHEGNDAVRTCVQQ